MSKLTNQNNSDESGFIAYSEIVKEGLEYSFPYFISHDFKIGADERLIKIHTDGK